MKTSSVNVLWLYVDGIQNVMEFAIRHNTKKRCSTYQPWKHLAGGLKSKYQRRRCGALQNLNACVCYPESKRLCETIMDTAKVRDLGWVS